MIKRPANTVEELVPLRFLAGGQVAEIGEVIGKPDQVHRLNELGLRLGMQVQMVQPGSPCIIRLGGQKFCFRESETMGVLVRPGVAG